VDFGVVPSDGECDVGLTESDVIGEERAVVEWEDFEEACDRVLLMWMQGDIAQRCGDRGRQHGGRDALSDGVQGVGVVGGGVVGGVSRHRTR
jgi:hypothetical protein